MNTTERVIVILPCRERGQLQAAKAALAAFLPGWASFVGSVWKRPDGASILTIAETGDPASLDGWVADVVTLWPGAIPTPEVLRGAVARTMGGRRPGTVVRLVLVVDEPADPALWAQVLDRARSPTLAGKPPVPMAGPFQVGVETSEHLAALVDPIFRCGRCSGTSAHSPSGFAECRACGFFEVDAPPSETERIARHIAAVAPGYRERARAWLDAEHADMVGDLAELLATVSAECCS